MEVDVCDGKYTVVIGYGGEVSCLRYGEEWRDCVGDSLIYNLAVELEGVREKLDRVRSVISLTEEWCADQGNGMTDGEICMSAMKDIRRHLKRT